MTLTHTMTSVNILHSWLAVNEFKFSHGILVFLVVSGIYLQLASGEVKKTRQNKFGPLCHPLFCPHFSWEYMSDWYQRQTSCCATLNGMVYHCQEQEFAGGTKVVSACLPKSTCSAGTYAALFTNESPEETLAWIECLPCDENYYESREKFTYLYRYTHCTQSKIVCDDQNGMTNCYFGGKVEDDKCRCLYEDGFAPEPDSQGCKCFGKHDHCYCVSKPCPPGEEMNKDYQCVQKSLISVADRSATTSKESHLTEENTPVTTSITDDPPILEPQLQKILTFETVEHFPPKWISTVIAFIAISFCGLCTCVKSFKHYAVKTRKD